jgi:hypothetical protein
MCDELRNKSSMYSATRGGAIRSGSAPPMSRATHRPDSIARAKSSIFSALRRSNVDERMKMPSSSSLVARSGLSSRICNG